MVFSEEILREFLLQAQAVLDVLESQLYLDDNPFAAKRLKEAQVRVQRAIEEMDQ